MKPEIPADRVRFVLDYNCETGVFTRKWCKRSNLIGSVANSKDGHGYIRIKVDGVNYLAHRLAWLWMTGDWPGQHIDHIDGNPSNNRWENLRCVTHQVNLQNRRHATVSNKSGFLGVTSRGGSHMARIKRTDGKTIHLGSYGTPEQAHEAYLSAKRKLHDGCTL